MSSDVHRFDLRLTRALTVIAAVRQVVSGGRVGEGAPWMSAPG